MIRAHMITRSAIAGLLIAAVAPQLIGCGPCSRQVAMNVITKQSLNGNGVTGGTVTIQGSNFAPGATIQVSYSGIPNRPGAVAGSGPTPTVLGDGTFFYQETWLCTSSDPADASASVLVTAKESSDSCFAAQNFPASKVFVCTGGNPANSRRDGATVQVAAVHVRGCNAPR